MGHFFYNKEGVTQGDPLKTVADGLGILPLIRDIRQIIPVSLSHGMLMTLGKESNAQTSNTISII